MASSSAIEWTDATWNPVAGCSIISAGCKNCYAMRMAARLERMGQNKYFKLTRKSGGRSVWTGKIVSDVDSLNIPYGWKKGRRVFVNSMSDLFHEKVHENFIKSVFSVMHDTPQHSYQLLTKRPERLATIQQNLYWSANIWLGVSIEDASQLWRLDHLKASPALTKFLSIEPLIGPIPDLDLSSIDWVIVGGESGPGARPIEPDWVRSIRDKCISSGVPFHFKQWGGPVKAKRGRTLDGLTWDQFPSRSKATYLSASK